MSFLEARFNDIGNLYEIALKFDIYLSLVPFNLTEFIIVLRKQMKINAFHSRFAQNLRNANYAKF